jgi:hypothetical protein
MLDWLAMSFPNQGTCQSRKTAENCCESCQLGDAPNQELVANPNRLLGTFAKFGASKGNSFAEESGDVG